MSADEDMAAVLAEHTWHVGGSDGAYWVECLGIGCEFSEQGLEGVTDALNAHRAHVAAALVAAGFGSVAAAKASALREAADALDDHTDCQCEDDHHLTHLASAKWLRARADSTGGAS